MSSTSMTVIRGRPLTTCVVSPDGESFAIRVTDEQARPASASSSAAAGAIISN